MECLEKKFNPHCDVNDGLKVLLKQNWTNHYLLWNFDGNLKLIWNRQFGNIGSAMDS